MAKKTIISYTEIERRPFRGEVYRAYLKDPDGNCHRVTVHFTYERVTYSCTKIITDDGGVWFFDWMDFIGKAIGGAGVVVMGAGGVIMIYSWVTGPAVAVTALGGASTTAAGGIIAAIGAAIKALGDLGNWLFGTTPTTTTSICDNLVRDENIVYTHFVYGEALEKCPEEIKGTISGDHFTINYKGNVIK
jgi:hypothetical protein